MKIDLIKIFEALRGAIPDRDKGPTNPLPGEPLDYFASPLSPLFHLANPVPLATRIHMQAAVQIALTHTSDNSTQHDLVHALLDAAQDHTLTVQATKSESGELKIEAIPVARKHSIFDFRLLKKDDGEVMVESLGQIHRADVHGIFIALRVLLNQNFKLTADQLTQRLEKSLPDLSGLDLRGIDTRNIVLNYADLRGAKLDRTQIEIIIQKKERRHLSGGALLNEVDLRGEDLSGLDLSKARIEGARLTQTILTDTNLEGAILSPRNILEIIAGRSRVDAQGIHDFRKVNILDLIDAPVVFDVLENIDFTGANLMHNDLRNVRLKNVNLRAAALTGTHFDAQSLKDVMDGNSRLNTAEIHDLRGINLKAQNLSGMDLRKVDLRQTELQEANLAGVLMSKKQLAQLVLDWVHYFSKPLSDYIFRAIPFMSVHIEPLAQIMNLKDGFALYALVPLDSSTTINKFRDLAEEVSLVLDGTPGGTLRTVVHSTPSPQVIPFIESYFAKAQGNQKALDLLNQLLKLAKVIYKAKFNKSGITELLSADVSQSIAWPTTKHPTLEELGALAISIRRTFDTKTLTTKERTGLFRLALMTDQLSYGLCALEAGESIEVQAQKMATLIKVMYGCGFGHAGWLKLADRIEKVSKLEALKNYGVLVFSQMEEVKKSFHELFDDTIKKHGNDFNLSKEEQAVFVNNQYRAKGLFLMANHLESLGIVPSPAKSIPQKVLGLLAWDEPKPWKPVFFNETFEKTAAHLLQLGGKGLGLIELTQLSQSGLFKVPRGFVLPAQMKGLDPLQRQSVQQALFKLEQQAFKYFDRNTLKVAVRSGAAISMQGLMDTYLNVSSADDVLGAINRVYQSWSGLAAREYQQKTGIPTHWGSAISVVEMIDPTMDKDSGSGVAKSSISGFANLYARQEWGKVLVDGSDRKSDDLPHPVDKQLKRVFNFLESVYHQPVEIEYAVQRGELYLLQVRKAPLTPAAEMEWAFSRQLSLGMTQMELTQLANHLISIQKINKYRVDTAGLNPLAQGTFGEGNPFVGPLTTNPSQYPMGQSIFVSPSADAKEATAKAMQAGAILFAGGNPLSHLAGMATTLGLSFLGGLDIKVRDNQIMLGDIMISEGTLLTLVPASQALYAQELTITEIENSIELEPEPVELDEPLAPELFPFMSLSPVVAPGVSLSNLVLH